MNDIGLLYNFVHVYFYNFFLFIFDKIFILIKMCAEQVCMQGGGVFKHPLWPLFVCLFVLFCFAR